jgi:hypothetical protein
LTSNVQREDSAGTPKTRPKAAKFKTSAVNKPTATPAKNFGDAVMAKN